MLRLGAVLFLTVAVTACASTATAPLELPELRSLTDELVESVQPNQVAKQMPEPAGGMSELQRQAARYGQSTGCTRPEESIAVQLMLSAEGEVLGTRISPLSATASSACQAAARAATQEATWRPGTIDGAGVPMIFGWEARW